MGWVARALVGAIIILLPVVIPTATRAIQPSTSKAPVAEPRAMVLADASSGRVLRERNADESIALGALGHLMLSLLVLERLDSGELVTSLTLSVSAGAAAVPGARLGLREGEHLSIDELLRALLVSGAPDAAAVLADGTLGSPAAAVAAMNERASSLGMIGTEYGSLSGTAASTRQPIDVTTARDTVRVTTELLRHSRARTWAALSGLPFRGGTVLLRNRNQMLGTVAGVDGLLVTESPRGGSHLVATARRGALDVIAVVLGAADNTTRYTAAREWLDWSFATFERIDIVRVGEPLRIPVRVRGGLEGHLVPVAGTGCSLLRRHGEEHHFELDFQLPDMLTAPIVRDQRVGEIVIRENDLVVAVVPAVSPADFPAADSVLSTAGSP